jgi:hypothetical protein
MVNLEEFSKLSGVREGAIIGSVLGLGHGISSLPKDEKHKVRNLFLRTLGGAVMGAGAGHAAKRLSAAIKDHIAQAEHVTHSMHLKGFTPQWLSKRIWKS